MKKLTNKEFLQKAKLIHGEKYDYSKLEYVGSKINIKIVCPEHGIFNQSPNSHLKGRGCPECGLVQRAKTQSSIESFITSSNKIHEHIYDYSLVQYINTHTKIKIICSQHGTFDQTPARHLSGAGCTKCATEKNQQLRRSNTEEFINKAIKVHGDKYDYSSVFYINTRNKIKINCLKHGLFDQFPTSHLNGVGCAKCNDSKGEIKIKEFLKKNNINFISQQTFVGCNHKRKLKFDFYLPEYNICIEYNGIQHYKSSDFFGGVSAFKEQVKRDKIKSNFCTTNQIELFIIKYDEIIEDKLQNLFNSITIIT